MTDLAIKLLLVDDIPENLLALEAALEGQGYELHLASSGAECLETLAREPDIAVIVLDVHMPEMDGFDTAEAVRRVPSAVHTPIVFLTAHSADEEAVERAYATGAVDYLTKPIQPVVLKSKIRVLSNLNWSGTQARDHVQGADEAETQARSELERALALIRRQEYARAMEVLEGIRSVDVRVARQRLILFIQAAIPLGDDLAVKRAIEQEEFSNLTRELRLELMDELEDAGMPAVARHVASGLVREKPDDTRVLARHEDLDRSAHEHGTHQAILALARRSLPPTFSRISLLGAGGCAFVCRAHWLMKDGEVAVKFLSPALAQNPTHRQRFQQESDTLRDLDHPNIVKVYGSVGGLHPCYAMELLSGLTLDQRADESGPMDLDEATHVATGLSRALRYLHEQGFVHRDVKPANVFITRSGVVKLMDFGLAKADWTLTLTRMGEILGTPAYMSPEQWAGSRDLEPSSDIFSLGVVLYELITGDRPRRPNEETRQMETRGLDELEAGLARAPESLRNAILAALDPDPDMRPDISAFLV